MKTLRSAIAAAALWVAGLAAAAPNVEPPPALVLDGIPPISADIVGKVRPYGEFRPHSLLSWHPTKREMLVLRRLNATAQLHVVSEPGAPPRPLTDLPDAVSNGEFQPLEGGYAIFTRGEGGNEIFRLYRLDLSTGETTALSPATERVSSVTFNRQGNRVAYATVVVDRHNPDRQLRTTLRLLDPSKPAGERVLTTFVGGTWTGLRFSEDGRRLAFVEFVSVHESHLWVMDVATGKRRRVTTPGKSETVSYGVPRFSKDGKALFATSDRGSEFRHLTLIPLSGGKERALTGHLAHDVDGFDISFEAGRIAFITNEAGSHTLRFLDLATFKELPRPALFHGVIGGLEWRRGAPEIGFHISSARSSGDAFSYDLGTNRLTRWTNGNNPEVNTREFPEPRLIRWKSFDGREITGFHYHPGERFAGRRPVLVNIHGGPEAQARPGFKGRNNYLVTELGIAMIYPNVRGSSGFGKTFLKLDNGKKREDAVKDIGALLEWIREQPDLDAERVVVMGGSYGGYMALATATHYSERIAGAMSSVGISSFVTFLERTETYRRDLRRAEYGDERDPEMRRFLESISPLHHAQRIAKPLFVVQGRNDPRVPYTEAEQIVAALKARGTPVWFLLANDEGHGFAKKPNADFLFYALVEFLKATLLG